MDNFSEPGHLKLNDSVNRYQWKAIYGRVTNEFSLDLTRAASITRCGVFWAGTEKTSRCTPEDMLPEHKRG